MTPKMLAGAGLAAVLSLGVAAPAALAETPSPSAPAQKGQKELAKRAARLCKRVPTVQARVTRLTAKYSGDVTTRGSVLWLQAKATKVRPKDAALADIIDGRAKIRQSRLATLKLRADQLPKVAAWCKAHGQ